MLFIDYTVCLWLPDAPVFLQQSSITADEGMNVSVCAEIELTGGLLADIEIEFLAIGGGAGAGKIFAALLKLSTGIS